MEVLYNAQKQFFKSHKTLDYNYRINALKTLKEAIKRNEDKLLEALHKDLGKSNHEAYMTEIGIVYKELSYMEKHLKKLMKKSYVRTELTDLPSSSYKIAHPYGVVLIISPWNYPVNLSFTPLIGAISAGNTAIIKPSEFSANTSQVIYDIIHETFDEEYVSVVQGGVPETQELLDLKFDYIFFTGSTNVGRIVMEKASKHLTPVSLELGGKSPVIVDEHANIRIAAKRIIFGKLLNSGQTCIAPDYLLVHEKVEAQLLLELSEAIKEYYGEQPIESNQYCSIINEKHYKRLKTYLEDGNIIDGGFTNDHTRQISPTILKPNSLDSNVMTEEIFGPILPVVTYKNTSEVIEFVNNRPHPLAFYLFTENKKVENKFIKECQFGGGCVNDTIVHIASDYLPFGGVGESGMGSYHGKQSFHTFSHYKSILKKATWFDLKVRYAPFTDKKTRIIKRFLR